MSIDNALAIAVGGLANVNHQMAVVSNNVANAGSVGYAREIGTQQSATADGTPMGVRSALTTRQIDEALQTRVYLQNANVAGLTTRQSALQGLDAVQGTPGAGNDLSSLVGRLSDAFSTLAGSPADQTQQHAVLNAAQTLTDAVRQMSSAYTDARQTAQGAIVAGVAGLNQTLASIGNLSTQIVSLQASHQSTADLENQRDAAVQSLSSLVDVKVLKQPNGDMQLVTASGLSLPTHATAAPFATQGATLGAGAFHPGGGIPDITLGGVDVTAQITGGQLGANIALRDTTLPGYQAGLDEFAQNLAGRFDAQGLRLFSDPTGAVPAGGGSPVQTGYVGFSAIIGVNPAVIANPAAIRDGTQTVAGSPTGASAFTPNPVGGPSGFTTMITRVLDYALGAQVQAGVAQPAVNASGLGPAGTLSVPYSGATTPTALAASLVGAQAQDSAATTTRLSSDQALQTTLADKLASDSGVNIDTEMSMMVQLQNAYGANAKVISAAQTMWTQLLDAVH